jgi:ABC-type sugar transport system substrate-binding protein
MRSWVLVSLLSDHQEYQRYQADEARAAAARGGLDAKVVFADSDPTRQIQQITEAVSAPVAARPLAVVVETAGSVGFERMARAALDAEVGWVLVSGNPRYMDTLRGEYPGKLVCSICVNNVEIGHRLARAARAVLPRGGAALVLEGPSTTAATLERRRGIEEQLLGSAVVPVKTLTADWTVAGAEKATRSWLKLAGERAVQPELVVSMNDEMAVGALQALRAERPRWGAISAIGVDGLPQGGQRLVREKVLSATIVCPASAGAGVDQVTLTLRGEKPRPVVELPVQSFPAV